MTKRYLLDTGQAFDCIFRRRGVHERLRAVKSQGAKVGIGIPVLGAIIAGVEGSQSRDKNWTVVARALSMFVHWPFEAAAAYEYGRWFAERKRMGRPMQQVDVPIAAIALTLGNGTVVSADSDLAAVPGLTVENWTS